MLYKITVKSNLNSNGVRLEKGMSVEVVSQSFNLSGGFDMRRRVRIMFGKL